MNYKDGEIASRDLKLGGTVNLHSSIKMLESRPYIDTRKWVKYPNFDDFVSTKKGIMLDFETWRLLIPQIQELMREIK